MCKIVFVKPNLEEVTINDVEGKTVLKIAEENDIALTGACGGNLACATCHVIIDSKWFDRVNKVCPPSEKEEDLLDYVSQLTPMSRLACQITMSKEIDGLRVLIPENRSNYK